MTRITEKSRTVARVTQSIIKGRAVCVSLGPPGTRLTVWLKGQRTKFSLPYDSIFWRAAHVAGELRRDLKKRAGRRWRNGPAAPPHLES